MYVPNPNTLSTKYAIVLTSSLYKNDVKINKQMNKHFWKKVTTWNRALHHIT